MNVERFTIIAAAVAIDDYLKTPESFDGLALLLSDPSTAPTLAPNVSAASGMIDSIFAAPDFLDIAAPKSEVPLPSD